MTTKETNSSRTKSRSFRFQFRLKTLVLLVVIAGVGMGWFSNKLHRAGQQQKAVVAIEGLGGIAYYDYQLDASGSLIPGAQLPGWSWLRRLLGRDFFASVVRVDDGETMRSGDFFDTSWPAFNGLTDADMVYFSGLTNLRELNLSHSLVIGDGLIHLKGANNLRSLWLPESPRKE